MFHLQEIEIIRSGKSKVAAYAIGQPEWHVSDYMGMNLRYKKISPLFDAPEECEKWVREHWNNLKFIRYRKGGWEVLAIGGHYDTKISGIGRAKMRRREVLKELGFNTTNPSPFP